jgi:hypothetical protein
MVLGSAARFKLAVSKKSNLPSWGEAISKCKSTEENLMTELQEHPVLCGGTFFTLLLQAAGQKLKERKKFGDTDNFTERDVFERLMKVANVHEKPNDSDNFASVVSAYKSCNTSKSGRLGFMEQAVISTFDNSVKSDYKAPLSAMETLVNDYITSSDWLVRALLELIDTDANIEDDQEFYGNESGGKITKSALRNEADFCLPAFLLGVWHFIIINRKDNAIGKATYDRWCPHGESKNTRKPFESKIGESIVRELCISLKSADGEPQEGSNTIDDNYTSDATQDKPNLYVETPESTQQDTATQIQYNGVPITVIAQSGGVGIGVNTAPITINNR